MIRNNTTFEYKPIVDVVALLNVQYGLEDITEDDILEVVPLVMEQIGNLYIEDFYFVGQPDDNGRLIMPCNAAFIHGVTIGKDRNWCSSLNVSMGAAVVVDQTILVQNVYRIVANSHKPKDYLPGLYIEYSFRDGIIHVDPKYKDQYINVAYSGEITDDNGIPLVTQREALAIAAYYAYRHALKQTFSGNASAQAMAQIAQQDYQKYVAQARVNSFSANQINMIKDRIMRRDIWSRKAHYKHNY